MDSNKVKGYDGKEDVKVFLTKLEAAIKGYADEKKAQYLASKLIPPAFDVYLRLSTDDKKDFNTIRLSTDDKKDFNTIRLSTDDKKDFNTIKGELVKEFEKGQLNREEAIYLLNTRRWQADESPQTYAYKLMEFVKLAYPEFIEAVRKTIAKDYFMRGVHPEMQIALKSGADFATRDISALADETVQLELAGITSGGKNDIVSSQKNTCYSHEVANINEIAINSIAGKVIERLKLNLPEGQSNSAPACERDKNVDRY